MNYCLIYNTLINKAKTQVFNTEYFEIHHILPKSLNGSDDRSNLVKLTARQHYIAHALLVKIMEHNGSEQDYKKCLYAFNCMKWGRIDNEKAFHFNSYLYEALKTKYAKLRLSMMKQHNPMFRKIWIFNPDIEQSKTWNVNDPIPDGWHKGRVLNFKNFKLHAQNQLNKKLKKIADKERKVQLIREMYEEFKVNDFTGVVQKFGYHCTRNNLIMCFKAYIPEYIPQVCNRWKNTK